MGHERFLFFTPRRVIQLAQGERTEAVPSPKKWDSNYKAIRVVGEVTEVTRDEVFALLEEIFEGIEISGLPIFYSQDRNLFWYSEQTSSNIVRGIKENAVQFLPKLAQARGFVREWLISKSADLMTSEQTLYPLVSTNGSIGDNSTRWGALIGDEARAGKMSTTPLVDCKVEYPFEHPNIMDETRSPLRVEWHFAGHSLHSSVQGCHLTTATNLSGTPNLDELIGELDDDGEFFALLADGLEGLQHIHEKGLVYCDFKVEQILVVDTPEGRRGKLSDLETLRPVNYKGDFLANRYINEDWSYNLNGIIAHPPVHLPVDHRRDVFSVGASLIGRLLRAKDPAFGLNRTISELVEAYNGDNFRGELEKLLEGKIDQKNPYLVGQTEALQNFRALFGVRNLGFRLMTEIPRAFHEAQSEEEYPGIVQKYTLELSQYLPKSLAGVFVRAMHIQRQKRPQLREIIEALRSLPVMAGDEGFEPPMAGPEPAALPLG